MAEYIKNKCRRCGDIEHDIQRGDGEPGDWFNEIWTCKTCGFVYVVEYDATSWTPSGEFYEEAVKNDWHPENGHWFDIDEMWPDQLKSVSKNT